MAIITYTSLNNIPKFTINKLPTTPKEIDEQSSNYNELAHAYSPSPFDLVRSSKTQPLTSQYCGAYCLTAAGATFGIFPKKTTQKLKRKNKKATFKLEDNFTTIALSIYKLSSFSYKEAKQLIKNSKTLDLAKKEGSTPQGLFETAKILGMKAKLYINSDTHNHIKSFAQKQKMKKDKTPQDIVDFYLGKTGEYSIVSTPMPTPKDDEINIVLMQTVGNSLHWIALSSDNTYFDSLRNFYQGSQFGVVGNSWSSRPYIDTGIWITLKVDTGIPNQIGKISDTDLFSFC